MLGGPRSKTKGDTDTFVLPDWSFAGPPIIATHFALVIDAAGIERVGDGVVSRNGARSIECKTPRKNTESRLPMPRRLRSLLGTRLVVGRVAWLELSRQIWISWAREDS